MKKLSMDELQRLTLEDYQKAKKSPIVLVLDNIRSLNNVGSAFRTGDAFRIEKIFLCGITGTPPHRDIQKTALGATDSVKWEYCLNTMEAIKRLKEENYQIVALEQVDESIFLQNFDPIKDKKYALVFGNEVFGVEDKVLENCDEIVEIPQLGTKHSLNISVSLGIAVWDLMVKMDQLEN